MTILANKQHVALISLVIALFCFLFLRNVLLLAYLPLVLFALFLLRQKIYIKDLLFLILMYASGLLSSVIEGFHWPNYLFSIYLLTPTFLLIRSNNRGERGPAAEYLHLFMSISSRVLFMVNISGFF
jgi:hypothetical protein